MSNMGINGPTEGLVNTYSSQMKRKFYCKLHTSDSCGIRHFSMQKESVDCLSMFYFKQKWDIKVLFFAIEKYRYSSCKANLSSKMKNLKYLNRKTATKEGRHLRWNHERVRPCTYIPLIHFFRLVRLVFETVHF